MATPPYCYTALSLDGSSAYVDISSSSLLNYPDLQPFTIEGWVFINANKTHTIVSRGAAKPDQLQYELAILPDCRVIVHRSTAPYQLISATKLSLASWHHVAVAFTGGPKNLLTLYIDGQYETSGHFKCAVLAQSENTTIGCRCSELSGYFHGYIARLRFWNKCCDISEMLNHSLSWNKPAPVAGVVANFDFTKVPYSEDGGLPIKLMGGATASVITPGLQLDGKKGFAYLVSDEYISLGGDVSYTIEGWANASKVDDAGVVGRFQQNSQFECCVAIYDADKLTAFRGSDPWTLPSEQAITQKTWFHFAVTYDSTTNVLSLYQNGNLAAESSKFNKNNSQCPNLPLMAGAYLDQDGLPCNYFMGCLLNARIWAKAFTLDELQNWMFQIAPLDEASLLVNFDFSQSPPLEVVSSTFHSLLCGDAISGSHFAVPVSQSDKMATPVTKDPPQYQSALIDMPVLGPTGFVALYEPFSVDHNKDVTTWLNKETRFDKLPSQLADKMKQVNFAKVKERFELQQKQSTVGDWYMETCKDQVFLYYHHPSNGKMLVFKSTPGETIHSYIIWWTKFLYTLLVGYLNAIGISVPQAKKDIGRRLFNKWLGNRRSCAVLQDLVSNCQTLTVSQLCHAMEGLYQGGVLLPIVKWLLQQDTNVSYWLVLCVEQCILANNKIIPTDMIDGVVDWSAECTKLAGLYQDECPQNRARSKTIYIKFH